MGRACSKDGKTRKVYRLLMGKKPLGISRHRWVDNIRIDFAGIGWGGVNWICQVKWRAVVNAVMDLLVP
jgi:hypothetical protein